MRKLLLILLPCLALAANALAQSTERDLKNRLLHKPLYLRGMWIDDTLHFDADGHLLIPSAPTSFTLAGIEVTKVHLAPDSLTLEGNRVGLELAGTTPKRVVLRTGAFLVARDEKLTLTIARPPSGDYAAPLDAILTHELANLAPTLPDWWQPYAQRELLHSSVAPVEPFYPQGARPYSVGGNVKPPFVAKQVEPTFNDYARNLQYQGKAVVSFVLDRDGKPSHFAVERPLGLGLDERAIQAIQQYVFGPATLNGRPVSVTLAIEANFEVY